MAKYVGQWNEKRGRDGGEHVLLFVSSLSLSSLSLSSLRCTL
jgi:hypothetical protein